MRHESESERRESHNATEQRRRLKINKNIQDLHELIPTTTDITNNKAAVLLAAVEYISQLKDLCGSIAKQNEQLEFENLQIEEDLAIRRGEKVDAAKRAEVHQHINSAFERPLRASSSKIGIGENESTFPTTLPMPIPRSNNSSGSTSPYSSYSLSITPSPSTSPLLHPDFTVPTSNSNPSSGANSRSNSRTGSNATTPSTSPNHTTTTTITTTLTPRTTTTTTTTTTTPNTTTTTTTTSTKAKAKALMANLSSSTPSEPRSSFDLGHILNSSTSSPPPSNSFSSS